MRVTDVPAGMPATCWLACWRRADGMLATSWLAFWRHAAGMLAMRCLACWRRAGRRAVWHDGDVQVGMLMTGVLAGDVLLACC